MQKTDKRELDMYASDVSEVMSNPPEGLSVSLEASPSYLKLRFKPKSELIRETPKIIRNISNNK